MKKGYRRKGTYNTVSQQCPSKSRGYLPNRKRQGLEDPSSDRLEHVSAVVEERHRQLVLEQIAVATKKFVETA